MLNGNRRGGFTLMELIVCIVVIAILATYAMPMFERFLERMRVAEADNIIGAMLPAQERYHIRRSTYTPYWQYLDASPVPMRTPSADNPYANGMENTVYYTNGGAKKSKEDSRAGFAISFQQDDNYKWFIVAKRIGKGKYNYTLVRPFDTNRTICLPSEDNEDDVFICSEYVGVDLGEPLPPDPRTILPPAD